MPQDDTFRAEIAFLSELLAAEHLVQNTLARLLPKGMEVSHFSVLNHLYSGGERSPAQLARSFNLTKGAMTNTLRKLEEAGYVHVRPDWDDARKKLVAISPSGRRARDIALDAVRPLMAQVAQDVGDDTLRRTLPVLRAFRAALLKG